MTPPFLCCALVTTVSALVSLGFSTTAVLGAQGGERKAALYTLVRSVALAVVSLASFVMASPAWLAGVSSAMILLQAGDGFVGLRGRDLVKTVGPFATAAVNLAALAYLELT